MRTKKRIVIAKVKTKLGVVKHVKYNVNKLESFANFLDKTFEDWYYINVFNKNTSEQIGNVTKYTPRPLQNI